MTGQALRWLENMEKTSFVAAQQSEKEAVSPFCQGRASCPCVLSQRNCKNTDLSCLGFIFQRSKSDKADQ